MASKASTPEVESLRQVENTGGNTLNAEDFENLDSQTEDFQATERDPCFPLNHSSSLEKDSVSTSRSSIDKKQIDFLENEKDERILVDDDNMGYPMPNSKTPKTKLSFINKIGRNGDGKKKLSFANSGFEKKIRKKLGLTHYGFVVGIVLLCLTILAFLVIIVLGITWPKTPHSQLFPICTKTACLRASSVMLPKLDRNISPCEDFYGFLCGDWSKKHSKPPPTRTKWGTEEEMDLKLSEMTRGVISTLPHPTRVNSLTWKMKNFYDSCMSLDNIETDGERPLQKIIQELGGWCVLREFSALSWDFSTMLNRLQAKHGVAPFFSVSVVSDPRNASRNILQLTPDGLGLPHKSYYYREKNDKMASSYRLYMKDVAQLLGATSTDANRFSEDMFYFERRIAEITPSTEDIEDIRKHEIHTISSLKTIAPSIPLHGLLDAMMNKDNIRDETEVLVTSTFYLSKISNIIATIDRSALNNYVIWSLVRQYLPYLSQSFTDIYYIYNSEMAGLEKPLERWEFCIKTFQKFMDFGLAAELEKRVPSSVREENKKVVEEIFESIRSVVKESVTKSDWIDLDLHKHMISKLDSLKFRIGYPNSYLDYSYLEEYYEKLYVQKNDFFKNIQYGVSFLQEEMRRRFATPREEYKWLSLMSSKTKVSYVPSANMVIIPQRLLNEPYFESDYPKAMLYGTLGVDIAKEIISSLLKYNVLYDSKGVLIENGSPLSNLSLTSTDNQLKCLIDLTDSYNIADSKITNKTSLNTFIKISAIRQSLKALKKETAESEHIHQAGLEEYENENLFYITYGQSLCDVKTSQQTDIDTTLGNSLGNKQLIKTIGVQLKSFAEAFGCPTPTGYFMEGTFTFEEISDEYTEEIKNKSIASNQSNAEIVIHPSKCVMPKRFKELFEIVKNFEVRPDDVWVVTYPKSGTTWTQEMVWLLRNDLDFHKAKSVQLRDRVPFFELETIVSKIEKNSESYTGTIEITKKLTSPRTIKSHLPVELLPTKIWSVKPKIIYVTRNPKDVTISYYHHFRLWNGYQGTLEDFVDVFLNDRIIYSPYWGHLLGFMDLPDKSHVLFNTYEDMKKDLGKVIRKTAEFLNVEINEEQVEQLKEHLSFKNMKENSSVNSKDMEDLVKRDIKADETDKNLNFIRRGECGEWRCVFGSDILEKFKKWNERHLNNKKFNEYHWA